MLYANNDSNSDNDMIDIFLHYTYMVFSYAFISNTIPNALQLSSIIDTLPTSSKVYNKCQYVALQL